MHLQQHLSAMSEAVELLANLEESESTSPNSHFPKLRCVEDTLYLTFPRNTSCLVSPRLSGMSHIYLYIHLYIYVCTYNDVLAHCREHEFDYLTTPRDVSDGSRSESASSSIPGSEREGIVRRVRHHLVSVSQQVGALEGKLEGIDVKKKVETPKGDYNVVTALFVVSLVAALMVLITNFYLEAFVDVNDPPPT